MKKAISKSYRERLNSAINHLRQYPTIIALNKLSMFSLGNNTQRAFAQLGFLVWQDSLKMYLFDCKGLSNAKIINQVREWQRIQGSLYNNKNKQTTHPVIKFRRRKATQVSLWSKLVRKVKSIFA